MLRTLPGSGCCTIEEIQERIDSRQFARFLAAYRLQPWGDDWKQAGTIAAATTNVWRGRGRGMTANDYIPSTRKARQSEQEMEVMLKTMAAANNRRFE